MDFWGCKRAEMYENKGVVDLVFWQIYLGPMGPCFARVLPPYHALPMPQTIACVGCPIGNA